MLVPEEGQNWCQPEGGSHTREGCLYYSGVQLSAGSALLGYSTRWQSDGIAGCTLANLLNLLWLSQRGGYRPLEITPHLQDRARLVYRYITHPILSKAGRHPLPTHSILIFTTLIALTYSPLIKPRPLLPLTRFSRPVVRFSITSD